MNHYFNICIIIFILLCYCVENSASSQSCYTSIFSFGDSLSDNGNLCAQSAPKIIHQDRLPNGETYFGHPTCRCCDGRLIIDFLAQNFGLPIPPPYLAIEKKHLGSKLYRTGVNFAVAGSRAVNTSFYRERGIGYTTTNVSLEIQVDWFKKLLPSLCETKFDCLQYLKSSLVYLEIGGDDYINALVTDQRSMEEVVTFVPVVIQAISKAITTLIELGVVTLLIPGSFPAGCETLDITRHLATGDDSDFDESTGCVKSSNDLYRYHNDQLQIELNHLRKRHPHATISYVDFYNSAIQFFRTPERFGFQKYKLRRCCGAGFGPYNYIPPLSCGDSGTKSCTDPSKYIIWDGLHYTETANKLIFESLLEGPYSVPSLQTTICPGLSTSYY